MKFARCLAVVSWVSVVALAVACGNAAPTGLFSDGEATDLAQAGADSAKAGSPAVTLDTAGADNGSPRAGSPGAAGATAISDGGAPTAGAGGSGGNAHGGAGAGNSGNTAGSGGSNAQAGGSSAGSSGSNAQAGSSSAGSAGSSGGTSGMSGASGVGGGSVAGLGCPSVQPAANTGCSVTTPGSCFYIGVACSCEATTQLPAQLSTSQRRWQCYGTPDRCPAAAPSDGTSCKLNSGARCPYPGGNYCACVGNGDGIGIGPGNGNGNGNGVGVGSEAKWSCQPAMSTCPAVKPFKDTQCSDVRSCAYPDDQCFCDGSSWACESND